jgi:hypothetical protein
VPNSSRVLGGANSNFTLASVAIPAAQLSIRNTLTVETKRLTSSHFHPVRCARQDKRENWVVVVMRNREFGDRLSIAIVIIVGSIHRTPRRDANEDCGRHRLRLPTQRLSPDSNAQRQASHLLTRFSHRASTASNDGRGEDLDGARSCNKNMPSRENSSDRIRDEKEISHDRAW